MLEIEMVPQKKNTVKVLLLLDIGGSMDDHVALCSQLFSAAKYEFKHLEFFYFHNCLYEFLWKENIRRWDERVNTLDMFNTFNSDYKVIIVGDASMSPYEIMFKQGAVEHYNEEAGKVWLERLKKQFKDVVWLNPVPEKEWNHVQSIAMIKNIMDNKMFPLTIRGIEEAILSLKNSKLVYN